MLRSRNCGTSTSHSKIWQRHEVTTMNLTIRCQSVAVVSYKLCHWVPRRSWNSHMVPARCDAWACWDVSFFVQGCTVTRLGPINFWSKKIPEKECFSRFVQTFFGPTFVSPSYLHDQKPIGFVLDSYSSSRRSRGKHLFLHVETRVSDSPEPGLGIFMRSWWRQQILRRLQWWTLLQTTTFQIFQVPFQANSGWIKRLTCTRRGGCLGKHHVIVDWHSFILATYDMW